MNNNENSYSSDNDLINEVIGSRMTSVGEEEYKEYIVPVAASQLLEYMAKELYVAVADISLKEINFTEDEVVDAFKDLLRGRINYVNGVRMKTHPKDVEYPAMLGPILAGIGVYHDEVANVTISATWETKSKAKNADDYDTQTHRIVSRLRAFGVPTVFGLPFSKTIDDDSVYRLEVADGIIKGKDRIPPSPVTIFTRAMLKMNYLMDLYGEARVSYSAVKRLERGVYDLVMRNVNRPRKAANV